MRRISGIVILVAIVLAAGGALGMFGRSWLDARQQGQASQPAAVATNTPPPQAAAAPPAAPTPTAGPFRPPIVATAGPSAREGPSARDMVLELSEGDLQAQMDRMLVGQSLGATPLGDATIQSVTVALRDRQVMVGGAARAGFVNAPFTAIGTVTPDGNGRPLVRISEATVGGVKLPDAAQTALADSLQSQVDDLFAERAMKVRTIDIADGKMRLVGTGGS